jgi:superfamily I DNA/RNA helicase
MASTGRNLLAEAQDAYPGDSVKHQFDVQMPYALALSNELLEEKFDAIVVDEAQDFSDEYWFAIEELLRDEVSASFIFSSMRTRRCIPGMATCRCRMIHTTLHLTAEIHLQFMT